jgi:hypothetical protein
LGRRARLAWLTVALFAGIGLFPVGGGFIALAALAGIAAAPGWIGLDDGAGSPGGQRG